MAETATTRITAGDFVLGMICQLRLLGWRHFRPSDRTQDGCDLCFNLSMAQAFVFLRQQVDDRELRFRIMLDWAHGTSRTLQKELSFLASLGVTYIRMPGDGTVFLDLHPESAERFLADIPLERALLREMARRFETEYGLPRKERTWPDDYELPASPFALVASRPK